MNKFIEDGMSETPKLTEEQRAHLSLREGEEPVLVGARKVKILGMVPKPDREEFVFMNPSYLKIDANKLDDEAIVFIAYQDGREISPSGPGYVKNIPGLQGLLVARIKHEDLKKKAIKPDPLMLNVNNPLMFNMNSFGSRHATAVDDLSSNEELIEQLRLQVIYSDLPHHTIALMDTVARRLGELKVSLEAPELTCEERERLSPMGQMMGGPGAPLDMQKRHVITARRVVIKEVETEHYFGGQGEHLLIKTDQHGDVISREFMSLEDFHKSHSQFAYGHSHSKW